MEKAIARDFTTVRPGPMWRHPSYRTLEIAQGDDMTKLEEISQIDFVDGD